MYMEILVNFIGGILMLISEHPGLKLKAIILNINETLPATFVKKYYINTSDIRI